MLILLLHTISTSKQYFAIAQLVDSATVEQSKQQILRNEYHCTLPKRFSRKKTSNTMMQTHRNEHKHVHQHLTHLICKCCATHQTTHNNTEPPGCPSFVILTLLHLNGISKHIYSKSYAVSMTFHDCDHFPGLCRPRKCHCYIQQLSASFQHGLEP